MSKDIIDVYNNDISSLKNKDLFLLDMDGTIYNENTLFDGVVELLDLLKKNNKRYVFITNNSSKSVSDYVNKLINMGVNVNEGNFFTSTQATAYYLYKYFNQKRIYCQGTKSFINELIRFGIDAVTDIDDEISAIVVGFDLELSSEKLRKTSYLLTKYDVPFIATNPDIRCPVSFGYVPDCGSICQMLTNATGKMPHYIGKPETLMIDLAIQKFCCDKEKTIIVGDRLYTDIASGNKAGVDTICVLSGETTLKDIEESSIKPTYILKNANEIINVF